MTPLSASYIKILEQPPATRSWKAAAKPQPDLDLVLPLEPFLRVNTTPVLTRNPPVRVPSVMYGEGWTGLIDMAGRTRKAGS